jgi:hypothetical protein
VVEHKNEDPDPMYCGTSVYGVIIFLIILREILLIGDLAKLRK